MLAFALCLRQKQEKEALVDLNVVILSAGKGERMASPLPKALHPVAGQPMLARILRAASGLQPQQIRVAVGPAGHIVSSVAGKFKALCFQQKESAWGTAQAVLAVRPEEMMGDVLIVSGDHPLVSAADFIQFVHSARKLSADCVVASFKSAHPADYGRLRFEGDQLVDIVESYRSSPGEEKAGFINAGLYLIKAELIQKHFKNIKKNIKEEYNLTDIVSLFHKEGLKVRALNVAWNVAFGVNSQRELSMANSIVFEHTCLKQMDQGVMILDAKNTYIEDEVVIGKGTVIYPGTHLKGKTKIGSFCAIESNVYIFDSLIRNYVNVKAGSYIEGSVVGEKSLIGPYAHLRPETVVGKECRVGNFVETKKTKMGDRSKASHLSYLGDAEIGADANIGCGVVTCNYGADRKKRKTKIGNKVFVGSGSQLVAPVELKDTAVVGAGSVITKNVPEGHLAIERSDQKNIAGYNPSKKKQRIKIMCGIFAYSGSKSAPEVLIKGLKNLEYRGYDSAGMAFFSGSRILRLRVCGGVEQLEKKITRGNYKSSLGIGHTRWATHGAPSEKNAHPHRSRFIYVVHNGVIENEGEIKEIIGPKRFLSETDTELIAHLIQYFCDREKKGFFQGALKALSRLKGSYAVTALHEKHPGEIIAFTSGPPLVICPEKKNIVISSDPCFMGKQRNKALFLEEGHIAWIKGEQVRLFNFKGEKASLKFKKYSEEPVSFYSKEGHPHFMLKEILEQARSVRQLISSHIDGKELRLKLSKGRERELRGILKNSNEIFLLACGSSYYSALFAVSLLEDKAQVRARAEIASEFIYRKSYTPPKSLALLISQSGETADILTALKQVQNKGLSSIALCNVPDSSLTRKTRFGLSLSAGPEVAVASTKAFLASLTALSLFALYVSKLKGRLNLKQERDTVKSFLSFPSAVEKMLCCDRFFLKIMDKLKSFKSFFYLGRGLYYPIAMEGALKLKEIAYLHAEAYPSGEMKHGPLAMIDKGSAVVALVPGSGILYKKSLINLREAKTRGACIISIGGKKEDKELRRLSDYHLPLPESEELFRPLLALIPLQLMAYYIARSYGYSIDKPRNLAKSVTVE